MRYSTRAIADLYEVIIRNGLKTLEYTQLQGYWNSENSKLAYKCPKQSEESHNEGILLQAWHVVSSANMFRALQLGKMLKFSSKGIGDKNIANNKIKSMIILSHSIGFIFDHIIKPEEILGETAGKFLHHAPDLLVAPSLNIYRLWDKKPDIPLVLKEAFQKTFHLSGFVLYHNAQTRYESSLDKFCGNTTAQKEQEENKLPTDNRNINLEMHTMNVDTLKMAGEEPTEQGEL